MPLTGSDTLRVQITSGTPVWSEASAQLLRDALVQRLTKVSPALYINLFAFAALSVMYVCTIGSCAKVSE
jgi:hypothetical protein